MARTNTNTANRAAVHFRDLGDTMERTESRDGRFVQLPTSFPCSQGELKESLGLSHVMAEAGRWCLAMDQEMENRWKEETPGNRPPPSPSLVWTESVRVLRCQSPAQLEK